MNRKKQKILLIGIRSQSELFSETRELFTRLDKGLPVNKPVYRLYFENLTTLWRTLTPKRIELMQFLREHGPLSIRKLAADLKRDYKNVHSDIKELVAVDLVKATSDDRYEVPWDEIDMKILLAA